jgi:hypothetical protein
MIKKISLINVLVVAIVARIVFKGAEIGDALALLPLIGFQCHQNYLKSKEVEPLSPKVEKQLADMQSTLNALKIAKAYGKI